MICTLPQEEVPLWLWLLKQEFLNWRLNMLDTAFQRHTDRQWRRPVPIDEIITALSSGGFKQRAPMALEAGVVPDNAVPRHTGL